MFLYQMIWFSFLTFHRTSFSQSLLLPMELGSSPAPKIVVFNSGIQEPVTRNWCCKVTRTASLAWHPAQVVVASPLDPVTWEPESGAISPIHEQAFWCETNQQWREMAIHILVCKSQANGMAYLGMAVNERRVRKSLLWWTQWLILMGWVLLFYLVSWFIVWLRS